MNLFPDVLQRLPKSVGFAISAIVYIPFSQWISTTRVGTDLFIFGQLVYLLALTAAVFASPLLVLCLFFKSKRRDSISLLFLSALLVLSIVIGTHIGGKIRMAGMRSFAERSSLLVTAIEQFEQEHSSPPLSLDALVPNYIPVIPTTGMMTYPEYQYHTEDVAKTHYSENAWALTVLTPNAGINFDQMMYLPNQNYPKFAFGGWLERVDDWAYVHE